MITKMKQILGAAAAMLMLAACGSPKTNLPLEGTQWKLTEMDGKADPAFAAGEDTFNFTLDPSRMMVYGVGACNRLFGPYELEEGNGLDIERLASTMMACPNMDLESRFAKLLEEADISEMPIEFTEATPKYNASMCETLGIEPLEGYTAIEE